MVLILMVPYLSIDGENLVFEFGAAICICSDGRNNVKECETTPLFLCYNIIQFGATWREERAL